MTYLISHYDSFDIEIMTVKKSNAGFLTVKSHLIVSLSYLFDHKNVFVAEIYCPENLI